MKTVNDTPRNKLDISNFDKNMIDDFVDVLWMEKRLSDNTISAYRSDLTKLASFVHNIDEGINLGNLQEKDLKRYLEKCNHENISARSISRFLSSCRAFYKHLFSIGRITVNPLANIHPPKLPQYLPNSLTEIQVIKLLEAPENNDPIQVRDKAMLELLYATGIRVSELVGLQMHELGMLQGVIRVTGKGEKERLVPMGEVAHDFLQVYLKEYRPELLKTPSNVVFPSKRGTKMTRQTFWHRIKHYAKVAGIEVHLSPHTLRHAFATHLLNHGADLRVVQMLLGHSDLSTTQIYTHIATHRLETLVHEHHPRG